MLYRLTKDLIFRNYCRKDPRNKSLYVSNSIFSYFIHLIWKPISAFRFLLKYIHCFQIQSFVSGWKFCFQNQRFISRIEIFFPESKFRFQFSISIWIPSNVSRIEALFLESKLPYQKQSFNSWKESSNLSRNNNLDTKLQKWIVLTSWEHRFNPEKSFNTGYKALNLNWNNNVEVSIRFQKRSVNTRNEPLILGTKDVFN